MSLFQELKRRNVFRVAAAYLVTAWLLIEVSATLEETLRLPEWSDSLLAMFLLLGFPVAVFFSWAYEITPEGLKKESDLPSERPSRSATGRKLDRIIMVMMALALGYFAVDKFVLSPDTGIQEQGAAAEPPAEPASSVDAPDNLSIAVLPFVNMSSDPEQEYFSDGLTEELLNLLAGIPDLKVAARTSSFFYKDKLNDIPFKEIGRQLEVAHLLEGSVRKGGDQIRITAQLIKAEDGFHLWSETWDRTLDDVFAIQDEIAAAVADQLKITLLGEAPHARVIDPESYELMLQGRFLFNRRLEGDMQRALELFEQAVAIDPNNAEAWIGLSPLYRWLFDPPRIQDALNAAQRAVDLDPDNPEALSRLAPMLYATGEHEAALTAWRRAWVELGEGSPLIQAQIAGYRGNRGDLAGAIEYQKKAVSLDPLQLTNLGNLTSFLMLADRFEEAEATARRMLELAPESIHAKRFLAEALLLQGRAEEALPVLPTEQQADRAGFSLGTDDPAYLQARVLYSLGQREAADAALAAFRERHADTLPLFVAYIHAWRGENDEAFAWIEKAFELEPELSLRWSWDPALNGLESDSRWQALRQRWEKNVADPFLSEFLE